VDILWIAEGVTSYIRDPFPIVSKPAMETMLTPPCISTASGSASPVTRASAAPLTAMEGSDRHQDPSRVFSFLGLLSVGCRTTR